MKEDQRLSPFSALSYKEQQDRWLEWRSRQLDFREGDVADETKKAPAGMEAPPVKLPNFQLAAPARHRNLDDVLHRHEMAVRQAGRFEATR